MYKTKEYLLAQKVVKSKFMIYLRYFFNYIGWKAKVGYNPNQ